jgi:hypothetical protein
MDDDLKGRAEDDKTSNNAQHDQSSPEVDEDTKPVLDRASLIKRHTTKLAQIKVPGATDHDKLAYFRACKGDIGLAQERMQTTMKWRTKTGISKLLKDPTWLAKEKEMRKTLWYDYLGPDQHGRPVLVERVGRWEVGKVLASIRPAYYNTENDKTSTEQQNEDNTFLKLHCMSCEKMLQMDRRQKDPPNENPIKDDRGQVVIMDLAGLGPWHLDPRLAIAFGSVAQIDTLHYPDTLAHVWVVNAPYLFHGLSKLVQPFLHPDTFGKFHVSSYVPDELIDCIGKDWLPEELGGSRKGIFPYNEAAPMSDHPMKK